MAGFQPGFLDVPVQAPSALINENQRLRGERDQCRTQLAQLQVENQKLRTQLGQLQDENKKLTARLTPPAQPVQQPAQPAQQPAVPLGPKRPYIPKDVQEAMRKRGEELHGRGGGLNDDYMKYMKYKSKYLQLKNKFN